MMRDEVALKKFRGRSNLSEHASATIISSVCLLGKMSTVLNRPSPYKTHQVSLTLSANQGEHKSNLNSKKVSHVI